MLLYTRSSFIKYLTNNCNCELTPMREGRGLRIANGSAKHQMFMTEYIDYDEIVLVCLKLYIELPPNNLIKRVE